MGVLVPLALLGLAACEGGEPATQTPSPSVPTASEPTTEELRAVVDAARRQATTARLVVESSGGVVPLSGEGHVDATTVFPGLDMTMSVGPLGGSGVELRLVDEVLYLRVPDLSDGKFFAFDVRDPDDPLGQELADQLDPRSQLEAIDRGVRTVVRRDTEVRGGVRLVVYELQVATEEVRSSLGPDAASAEAQLPEGLTYVVGFDERQRLRRLTIELGGDFGTVEMSFDDWGEAVDIQRPAEDLLEEPVTAAG